MFAGHAAYRFKQDPFYSNGFVPSVKQRIVHLAIGRERENARRRRPDDGRPPSGHAPTCNACLYPHDPPGGQALCCCFRRPCRHVELLPHPRSEEHTSELQSLMRNSYAVLCLKQKTILAITHYTIL